MRREQRAFVLQAQGVGGRIVSGASYKLTGTVVRTVITLGSTAILARLLQPSDYGYLAMATIVTELAALFSTAGITDTLVQRRRVTRIQLDTAFWTLLAIGLTLAASVGLVSMAAGTLFGDAAVGPIVLALGLLFPLNALAAVPTVLMNRLMDFKAEFWIGNTSLLLRSLAAVVSALHGLGVWSLVVGAFVGVVVTTVGTFWRLPFKPRLRFSVFYLKSVWRVSSLYLGGGLVIYGNSCVDLLLVGRWWGAAALGLYQNARALGDELRARLAAPLAQTLFPAFSSVQSDGPRMADLFVRSSRVLAVAIMLPGALLSALSAEVVEILYGPRWSGMVPLLSLFALSAAIRGSTALASPLLNAANRPGLVLKQHAIGTVLLIIAAGIALPWGIHAVAAAVCLASLYTLVPFRLAAGVFGLSTGAVMGLLGRPALAAAVSWALVAALRAACEPLALGPLARLLGFGLFGVAIFGPALRVLAPAHWSELATLAKRLMRR